MVFAIQNTPSVPREPALQTGCLVKRRPETGDRRPRKRRPPNIFSMIQTIRLIIASIWRQSSGEFNSAEIFRFGQHFAGSPFSRSRKRRPPKIFSTIQTIRLIIASTWRQSSGEFNSAEIFRFGQHFAGSPFSRSRKRRPPKIFSTIQTIRLIIAFTWRQSSGEFNSAEIFTFGQHFGGVSLFEISKTETLKNMLDGSHNSPDNCSGLAPVERDVEQRRAFVKFRKHFAGSPTVRWKTAEYCATRWKFDQSAELTNN